MSSPELSQTLHTMSHEELLAHLQKSLEELKECLDINDVFPLPQWRHQAVTEWAEKFYEEMRNE